MEDDDDDDKQDRFLSLFLVVEVVAVVIEGGGGAAVGERGREGRLQDHGKCGSGSGWWQSGDRQPRKRVGDLTTTAPCR